MSLMNFLRSLRSAFRAAGSPGGRKRPNTYRPWLQPLEDRTLPATFYAASVSDLIADIRAANTSGGSNSIILTAPTTSPYVLTAVDNLTDGPTGLPVIAAGNDLTIVGDGDTIERSTDPAAPNFRLLDVASGASLTLQNLILQNGVAEAPDDAMPAEGGGILNRGSLILSGVTVQNNQALGPPYVYFPSDAVGQYAYGGGVASFGALSLLNGTRIQSNYATGGYSWSWTSIPYGGDAMGGGVYVGGGTANLTGATLSGNTAQGGDALIQWEDFTSVPGYGGQAYGGGLYVQGGTVTLSGSTVSSNQAFGGSSPALGYLGASAYGGGIYIGPYDPPAYLDTFTMSNTINNFAEFYPNIAGPYFVNGAPTLAITDVSVLEGNSGTTAMVFTVSLSAAYDQTVTVDFATADGTATAGSDYQAASGTLTFAAGETSKTISVLVNGDRVVEPNETFFVNLNSPTNATITDGQGQGTIVDDEPRVSINDVTMTEGNSGLTAFAFTVSLSEVTTETVTVDFTTADASATADGDYQAASGTLTIPAGQTSGTITVLVNGDRVGEPNETFFVNLSEATNATIADGQGQGTIVDDEPRISISDVTKNEGKKGQTTLFTFTVTLSAAYDEAVTMSFKTVDGTAKTSDKDYLAKTGTLTFAPGETTKTITIEVKGDSKKEANETFYLDLFGNSSNALFTKNRGIGTILNDD